jgi:hypothetical protein
MTVCALPGVTPIEVWDLPVAGRLLQAWRADAAFGERLADAVQQVRATPPAAWEAQARALARRISHVHLCGGAGDLAIAGAIAGRGLSCTSDADAYAAAEAASRLASGLGVDVGQSAIKCAFGDRALRFERDLERAPLRDGVPVDRRPAARASTLTFLADALVQARDTLVVLGEQIRTAVLALPCEIGADGHPRSCTYAWRDPDRELVGELVAKTHLAIAICNDAALAAHAHRRYARRGGVTLVLTIGFGVGGALIDA